MYAALSLRVEREEAAVKRDEVQHELEQTLSQLSKARGALLDGRVGSAAGVRFLVFFPPICKEQSFGGPRVPKPT